MNSMNVDLIRAGKTRAILAFSVPAIISMVLTSLINVADGFFMGNFIHKDAIAAVNLGASDYLSFSCDRAYGFGGRLGYCRNVNGKKG